MNKNPTLFVNGNMLERIDGVWYGVPQIGTLVAFNEEQGKTLDKAYKREQAANESPEGQENEN